MPAIAALVFGYHSLSARAIEVAGARVSENDSQKARDTLIAQGVLPYPPYPDPGAFCQNQQTIHAAAK